MELYKFYKTLRIERFVYSDFQSLQNGLVEDITILIDSIFLLLAIINNKGENTFRIKILFNGKILWLFHRQFASRDLSLRFERINVETR